MLKTRSVDIDALIKEDAPILDAIRRGGIEAMKRHIQTGVPMVSWRDGKVVTLHPEELKIMLERYELEGALER